MWVSIDFCLIPLGVGVSLSPYIAVCGKIIKESGLDYEIGPNGTALEGDWDKVFECVKSCHNALHELGSPRIYTTVKINTRSDVKQSFRTKVPNVISKLDK